MGPGVHVVSLVQGRGRAAIAIETRCMGRNGRRPLRQSNRCDLPRSLLRPPLRTSPRSPPPPVNRVHDLPAPLFQLIQRCFSRRPPGRGQPTPPQRVRWIDTARPWPDPSPVGSPTERLACTRRAMPSTLAQFPADPCGGFRERLAAPRTSLYQLIHATIDASVVRERSAAPESPLYQLYQRCSRYQGYQRPASDATSTFPLKLDANQV